MPITQKTSGKRPPAPRLLSAGINSLRVRSPEAPKITNEQGSAGRIGADAASALIEVPFRVRPDREPFRVASPHPPRCAICDFGRADTPTGPNSAVPMRAKLARKTTNEPCSRFTYRLCGAAACKVRQAVSDEQGADAAGTELDSSGFNRCLGRR